MKRTATVETGDLEITFEAEFELGDYGVPGSPVWEEIRDVEVIGVAVWGKSWGLHLFSKNIINQMLELAPQDPEDYR